MKVPDAYMIAEFIWFYDAALWMSPLYDTTDHVIPARHFAVWKSAIPHLEARAHLLIKQGVQAGYVAARSDASDVETRWRAQEAHDLAFPRVPLTNGVPE